MTQSLPRLLVIDDEEDICDTVSEIAADYGFDVQTISHSDAVASALDSFRPHAIIMDLMMPGMDGVELLRMLAEASSTAKITLMSGNDSRVLNSARKLGSAHGLDIVGTLEKPIGVKPLRDTLDLMRGTPTASPSISADLTVADALAAGQIVLHYQPIVEISTRTLVGAEALVRWNHPTRGLLSPAVFVEEAEQPGIRDAFNAHIIKTAVTDVAGWHAKGEKLWVSINISAGGLLDLSLPDRIGQLAQEHALPSGSLVIEVTETEAMHDVTRIMDVLVRMRLRGIGLAVDDFGTGYSSLKELHRMPFSRLKIDQSFVTDMAQNSDSALIVKAVIDLGHNLGLKVIAEGIEDAAVWSMLRDRGCDLAQGYYVSRPLAPADFHGWIENWRNGNAL
jgi:EAL domain-containing protein (putative c-di-GMP-specific phosphodiesterase class I)